MAGHSGDKNQAKIQPHQDVADTTGAFPLQKNPTLGQNTCFPHAQAQLEKLETSLSRCGTQRHVPLGVGTSKCPPPLAQTRHTPSYDNYTKPLKRGPKQPVPAFPLPAPGQAAPSHGEPGCPPPHPAWEAGGTRAAPVGTEGFQTCRTCSLRLGGPATPRPKPSGQSNQPGQVWARMFGTQSWPPRLQPPVPPLRHGKTAGASPGCCGTAAGRIQAPTSLAKVTPVSRIKPGFEESQFTARMRMKSSGAKPFRWL